MVNYLQALVLNGRQACVSSSFRGHIYLPCDRDFGVIENITKKEGACGATFRMGRHY